jgi:hypothetical protein
VLHTHTHRSDDDDEVERSKLGNMGLASPSDRLVLRVSIIYNSLKIFMFGWIHELRHRTGTIYAIIPICCTKLHSSLCDGMYVY